MQKFRQQLPLFCQIVLGLAILAGLILRFTQLGRGLTYDELYSAASAWPFTPLSQLWQTTLSRDINPPLFNLALYGWNHLFSFPTETLLRLPGVMASLATLAAAYFFAPRGLNRLGKLTLTGLFAVGYFPLYYAQDARAYPFALLVCLLLLFTAIRLIHALREQRALFLLCTVFFPLGLAACYLHYFAGAYFFCLCLPLAAYAWLLGRNRMLFTLAPLGVLLAFIPWLYHAAQSATGGTWWIDFEASAALGQTAVLFFGTQFAASLAVTLIVWGGWKGALRKEPAAWLSVTSILLLLGVCAALSVKVNLWLPRYFIVCLPAVYLLTAMALQTLAKRDWFLAPLAPLLVAACLWASAPMALNPHKGLNGTLDAVRRLSAAHPLLYDASRLAAYPPAAVPVMMSYYPLRLALPQRAQPATAHLLRQPSAGLLVPVCDEFALADLADRYALTLPLSLHAPLPYSPGPRADLHADTAFFLDACAVTPASQPPAKNL